MDTAPLPSTPSALAHRMWEAEQRTPEGAPDPANAMWEQLLAQEGYDVASPLWSAACAHYDALSTDDES